MDAFIGEIRLFGFGFNPRNWAPCNGQLMAIAQNQALFALLGTTYGGNGTTTFALPDLRGRRPLGTGSNPPVTPGSQGGAETHTLLLSEMPSHTHTVGASNTVGNQASPANAYPARSDVDEAYSSGPSQADSGLVVATGGNQPHENRPPFLALNFAICISGIFPSRN
ncbi:microcystin-dependent protein [Acidovorax sp. CF316]|uniref:phage tail protein n=1 Tax=Acidovorax sp. CF316 TaxID=1144317 RepID=UPI00026BC67A|nr:tail fiber protein [Acidovorax sp. CF316]EJE54068.1 microcystin-dependent protein [Acidovorax sp. CF316]